MQPPLLALIDYGSGNLRSVSNAPRQDPARASNASTRPNVSTKWRL